MIFFYQFKYESTSTITLIFIRAGGCGNPIPPALGFIMSQASDCTSVGSTTSYQCSAGLVPQDVKSSECISDGTWSPDPSQLICFGTTTNLTFIK